MPGGGQNQAVTRVLQGCTARARLARDFNAARWCWWRSAAALCPKVDRAALMELARDLPTTWNAMGTDAHTKQRITHILIGEVVLDLDDATNEAIVTIHWNGGRHT